MNNYLKDPRNKKPQEKGSRRPRAVYQSDRRRFRFMGCSEVLISELAPHIRSLAETLEPGERALIQGFSRFRKTISLTRLK